MNWLKQNWFKLGVIILATVFISFQFYKEFKPVRPVEIKKPTPEEQVMECLKLGSDMRSEICLKQIGYLNEDGTKSFFYGLFGK